VKHVSIRKRYWFKSSTTFWKSCYHNSCVVEHDYNWCFFKFWLWKTTIYA